ncbi:hypothetical protein ABK040_007075 [Willaertia magna]
MDQKKVRVVGIAGGICSGKTTIYQHLKDLVKEYNNNENKNSSILFHFVPTDELGWKAYEPNTTCYFKVIETFTPIVKEILGDDVSLLVDEETKAINRRVLGKIVFADPSKMKVLTDIVWPEIERLINLEVEQVKQDAVEHYVVCFVESAVLIEANWHKGVDDIWIIDCSNMEERINRICKRNQLSEEEAKQRISSQLSTKELIEKIELYNNELKHHHHVNSGNGNNNGNNGDDMNYSLEERKQLKVHYFDTFNKTIDQVKEETTNQFKSLISTIHL